MLNINRNSVISNTNDTKIFYIKFFYLFFRVNSNSIVPSIMAQIYNDKQIYVYEGSGIYIRHDIKI